MDNDKLKDQIVAVVKAMEALQECIEAAGPKGIPSGELYARVCGNLNVQVYQRMIDLLVEAGKITAKGHLLIARAKG